MTSPTHTPAGWTITPPAAHPPGDPVAVLLDAACEALRTTGHIGRSSTTVGELYDRIGALTDLAGKLESVTAKLAADANAMAERPGVEPAGACLNAADWLRRATTSAVTLRGDIAHAHTDVATVSGPA